MPVPHSQASTAPPARGGHRAPGTHHSADGWFAAVLRAATAYAIIGTDTQGTVIVFNSGAERLLGYRADEVIGKLTPLAFHDPLEVADHAEKLGLPPSFEVLAQAARTGCTDTCEWTYVRKNGTRLPVTLTVSAMRDEDGELLGFIGIAQDVTERRRAEETRRLLERQKDEFFANVSHDLRTPLTIVKASVGAILANEPADVSPLVHRLLVNVETATDDMARLVEDLLDIARLQAGKIHLDRRFLDLRLLAQLAVDQVAPLAAERRQTVRMQQPAEPVWALVDAERIGRVMSNLLANAQRYAGPRATIEVQVRRVDGTAWVAVMDDGPGIPPEEHERVFDRFYRLDGEPSQRRQGSGLGLPIARALVELHGGQMGLTSSTGVGTTFWFELPGADGHVHAPTAAQEGAPSA